MSRFKAWLNSNKLLGSLRKWSGPLMRGAVPPVSDSSELVDELIVFIEWSTRCVATLLTVSTRLLLGCIRARLLGALLLLVGEAAWLDCDDETGEPPPVVLVDGRRKILNVERRLESVCFVENFVRFWCSFQFAPFLLFSFKKNSISIGLKIEKLEVFNVFHLFSIN